MVQPDPIPPDLPATIGRYRILERLSPTRDGRVYKGFDPLEAEALQDSEVGRFVRQEEAAWSAAKNEFRGFEIVR